MRSAARDCTSRASLSLRAPMGSAGSVRRPYPMRSQGWGLTCESGRRGFGTLSLGGQRHDRFHMPALGPSTAPPPPCSPADPVAPAPGSSPAPGKKRAWSLAGASLRVPSGAGVAPDGHGPSGRLPGPHRGARSGSGRSAGQPDRQAGGTLQKHDSDQDLDHAGKMQGQHGIAVSADALTLAEEGRKSASPSHHPPSPAHTRLTRPGISSRVRAVSTRPDQRSRVAASAAAIR